MGSHQLAAVFGGKLSSKASLKGKKLRLDRRAEKIHSAKMDTRREAGQPRQLSAIIELVAMRVSLTCALLKEWEQSKLQKQFGPDARKVPSTSRGFVWKRGSFKMGSESAHKLLSFLLLRI